MNHAACRLFLPLLLLLSSCSFLKAPEAPDSGFLDKPELLKEDREHFPFNKVWLKDYDRHYSELYSEILVRPVDTTHVHTHSWLDDLNLESKEAVKNDLVDISEYMRVQFAEEIEKDPYFRLAQTSGRRTMILELALVELVPTKAWLNVTGNIASFFLPGAAIAAGLESSGSIAIEGRIRDGATGEVIAMFKDHERDQLSPLGIQDFTWYHHAEDAIDDWAAQVLEVLDTPADHAVADSAPLTLRLW